MIFNRFFTARPGNPEHIGLDDSLSYDIIRRNQESVKAETDLGEFTEFRIIMPKNWRPFSQTC